MATQRQLNTAFARGYQNEAAPMQAFSAGFDTVIDPVIKREAREKEIARLEKKQAEQDAKKEQERLDIIAANSIGRIGQNFNPAKVPAAMRPSLENFLGSTKGEVGRLAIEADAKRKQFGAASPEYIELQTQISNKRNLFEAANQIALDQQELTRDYIQNRQKASAGVNISRPGLLNKIQYVLDPNLQQYEIDWTNASDPTYFTPEGPIKHSELDDYYVKDSQFGGGIQSAANTIYNNAYRGKPLSEAEINTYRQGIINGLESGGEGRVQSVLHDKLVEGFSLSEGIDAADYEKGIYDPQLYEAIADNILKHYKNVAQQGLAAYNKKSNPSTSFKPEDIAEVKNIIEIFNRPEEGALIKGMGSNSNIVYTANNWYPATESGVKATEGPLTVARAINRLQISPTLYKQVTGKDIPYDAIVKDPVVNDPLNPNE